MRNHDKITIEKAVIRFAGDSGDGIQLIGSEFTNTTAQSKNDLGTFPDFPAEIRAPQGTVAGVSGFQIQFGSNEIHTPGDECDCLVVFNAAALKKNLSFLKKGGYIFVNEDGFDAKNLRLAKIQEDENPLNSIELDDYKLVKLPISKIVKEVLKDSGLGTKDVERSKNMFVLGLLYWLYNRDLSSSEDFIKRKFIKNDLLLDANLKSLNEGFNYGETIELIQATYNILPAKLKEGVYRNITGNTATAYGLIAASKKAGLKLFYGTYPITPASEILHELSKHKHFDVLTFQAEDEIAAISSAIGASYAGNLGITASSGPGIDLKAEAMGLALMLEIPLVIINVQRAGPSTGMPTKTEQADLLLAFFGRHGESPLPIIAAQSPVDCFYAAFEACQISIEHNTPVILLSDGYIANGSEPWNIPNADDLPFINAPFAEESDLVEGKFLPYKRDENLVRKWAIPGTKGFENRIGGIEKEDITGNISYESLNHQKMTDIRANKVQNINKRLPELKIENGPNIGKLLILGWGGTFGTLKTACMELNNEDIECSFAHLRYLNPFPKNLEAVLNNFEYILIPEINSGQLSFIVKSMYGKNRNILQYNKIQGLPFKVVEIKNEIINILNGNRN